MKLRFLVCAAFAIVDEATKNISITSILEQLTSPTFPAAVPITVVGNFLRTAAEPDSSDIRLSFKIEGNQDPILDQPITLHFQGQLTTRLIAQVNPLLVPQQGRLIAEVKTKTKTLGSWTIEVKKAGNEMLLLNPPSAPTGRKRIAKKAAKKSAAKKPAAKKRA
jgi:hypothetical protein